MLSRPCICIHLTDDIDRGRLLSQAHVESIDHKGRGSAQLSHGVLLTSSRIYSSSTVFEDHFVVLLAPTAPFFAQSLMSHVQGA